MRADAYEQYWEIEIETIGIEMDKKRMESDMSRYVVVADFEILPDDVDQFIEYIVIHATNSRILEPGCRLFEVCQDSEKPNLFCLYEVYDDVDAYKSHRVMPSYIEFMSRALPLLVKHEGNFFKSRRVLHRLSPL